MTDYQITSRAGLDMGTYQGETPEEAIEAVDREAGYASSEEAARALGTTVEAMRAELTVVQADEAEGPEEVIAYSAVVDCVHMTGRWTGQREEAVTAAVGALDADRETGGAVYCADETGGRYYVCDDALAMLGAALLSGHDMDEAYSIWCAEAPAEEWDDHELSPGDRIEGGQPGTEDYDTGRVIAVDGDDVTVAWSGSNETTTQSASALRPCN